MAFVFWLCFIIGGTVLVCQFLLTLLGLTDADDFDTPDDGADFDGDAGGADHDGHGHAGHGSNWFFGVITFRTVIAALAFFGLGGLAARSTPLGHGEPILTVLIAVACGLGAMYGVHWMMQSLHRLKAEGTVRIESAMGRPGSVYLRIPGQRAGSGKVTLALQGRTVEYQATTSGETLPTGAKIIVVGIVGPETVEVELAPEPETSNV
jgi:hypothetical protein